MPFIDNIGFIAQAPDSGEYFLCLNFSPNDPVSEEDWEGPSPRGV